MTSDYTSATSELDAINAILIAIGESPIVEIENTFWDQPLTPSVGIARNFLIRAAKRTLEQGWSFNTETDYTLALDGNSKIPVSSNVVKVTLKRWKYSDITVGIRGSFLYDTFNNTYTFDKALVADIVYLLDWDDIPETAKQYIIARACRLAAEQMVGDSNLIGTLLNDERSAWVEFCQFEAEPGNYNESESPDMQLQLLRAD